MLPNAPVTLTDVAREMTGTKVIEKPLTPTPDCPPGFVRVRDVKTGAVVAVLREDPTRCRWCDGVHDGGPENCP